MKRFDLSVQVYGLNLQATVTMDLVPSLQGGKENVLPETSSMPHTATGKGNGLDFFPQLCQHENKYPNN